MLQVHAVLSPTRGLFDAKRAQAWLDAYAAQTRKPWRVALPAYGSRVAWDDEGRIAAVESEQPALMPGGRSAELLVTPADMAAFVSRIEDRRPPGLAGIVWFRLPTRVDARAWSLPTWRAVLARQPLRPALSVSAQAAAGGARDSYSRTPAMPTPRSPSPCGWTAPAPPPTASTATRWNATD